MALIASQVCPESTLTRELDATAVQDLILARAPGRRYTLVMPTSRAKLIATLTAAAALVGYVLVRTEDDHGSETFIATREASTLRFHSVAEVDAWIDQQTALRAARAGAGA
jgi:hypothetical protein